MSVHSLQKPPGGIDIPEAELPILELATDLIKVRDRYQLGAAALGVAGALGMVSNPTLNQPPELAIFTPDGELITAYGTFQWRWCLQLNMVSGRPGVRWTDVIQRIIDGPRDDERAEQLADMLAAGVDGTYEIESGKPLSVQKRKFLYCGLVALAVAQRGHGNEPIWPEAFAGQAVGGR